MKQSYFNLSLLFAAMAALPLSGCVDDNYDLSDIDTTVRVQVNDLEVPVNLDAITLSNIFDLDDESVVKEIDGAYSVLVDGDFSSEGVKVAKVDLGRPSISPVVVTIGSSSVGDLPSLPVGQVPVAFPLTDITTDFEFNTSSVDKSILAINNVKTDWVINIALSFDDPSGVIEDMKVSDLRLQLPHGLVTPDYANDNGVITIGDRTLVNGRLEESIRVSAIDFSSLDGNEFSFTPDATGAAPGTLSYKGSIGVKGGLVVASVSTMVNIPSQLTMTLDPTPAAIVIDRFSGRLKYAVDGFNVSSVSLDNLPDVLTQKETNIRIANPQLYLAINNPLAGYGVDAHSGLTLTAVRPGGVLDPFPLPAGSEIFVGHDKGIAGPYNICLSAKPVDKFYPGYEDATRVDYPGLTDVLSGNGLPERIDVSFDNTFIGPSDVADFELGVTLSDIGGKYTFYAPLSFDAGSQIVYSDEDTGWSDETLDKMTIETLGVTAHVENDLPFDIVLSGYPLDRDGNQCVDPFTNNPVSLGEVRISAGKGSDIRLVTDGVVTGVDGIRYSARAEVTEGNQTLRPSTTINLTNIRAIVSGYYEDKL